MKRSFVIVASLVLALVVAACGGGTATAEQTFTTQTPAEIASYIQSDPPGLVILDVRTPEEFAQAHLPGAIEIDFYAPDFAQRLDELDKDVPYVLYCHSGNRSGQTMPVMKKLGFREVHEIQGGIANWYQAGLPLER